MASSNDSDAGTGMVAGIGIIGAGAVALASLAMGVAGALAGRKAKTRTPPSRARSSAPASSEPVRPQALPRTPRRSKSAGRARTRAR